MKLSFSSSCFAALACLGLASGCASPGFSDRAEQASQWVALASSALQEGDAVGALQSLKTAEEINPKDPQLHHVRALAFLGRRELDTAHQSIRRAAELAPSDSSIRTTHGKILMDLGRPIEAEAILVPAANDPLYRDAYRARTNLAIIYKNRGDLRRMRDQLDRAILEAPQLACHAYFFRSELAMKEGAIRSALKDLEYSTTQACSMNAEAHLAMGVALTRSRQFDRARAKFIEIGKRFKGTEYAEKAAENLRYLP